MTDQQEKTQEMPNDLMKMTKAELVDLINQRSKEDPIEGEYPVSWHVEYTISGFRQNLFIRGFDGSSVLGDAKKALEYLKNHTAEPWGGYYNKKNGSSDDQTDKKVCPIHQVELVKFNKNGRTWFAHKYYDESGQEQWCKGIKEKVSS